jgi:hypothetical protein
LERSDRCGTLSSKVAKGDEETDIYAQPISGGQAPMINRRQALAGELGIGGKIKGTFYFFGKGVR